MAFAARDVSEVKINLGAQRDPSKDENRKTSIASRANHCAVKKTVGPSESVKPLWECVSGCHSMH